MRIGIDIRTLHGANGGRGIGNFAHGLLRDLCRVAPEHEYVLFQRAEGDAPPLPPFGVARVRAVPVPTPPVLPYRRGFRFPVFRRLYHAYMRRRQRAAMEEAVQAAGIDVLHQLSLVEDDYFADAGYSVPTVATLYDLIPLVLHAEYLDTWMDADRERYRAQVAGYASATAVVAISQSARADAIRLLGLAPERVRVALPSVATPPPTADKKDAAAVQDYRLRPGKESVFLYGSGSGPNKNLVTIASGYAKYARGQTRCGRAPRRWVVVGSQPEETVRAVRAVTADLDPALVEFRGFVDDDSLGTLRSQSRALVCVTRYEGFGLPAAEAMAAGLPVLAANGSSYPEVVGDAGLLVDPGDPDAIAEALRRLDQDDTLCARLGAAGSERAARLFSPERQAREYLAVYAEAAGR